MCQSSPSISVIVPCRNEARFISACLDSILANDYPRDRLEILVVDGGSRDGTRQIVERYSGEHPNVRLVDNPRHTAPAAMNIGVHNSTGEFIARFDAHSTCDPRYLAKCVAAVLETGADNVGGGWTIRPQHDTQMGHAISYVLSHWFGAGNAHYKIGTPGRRWVDTVPFGFYRRRVLVDLGLFNESLVRNQDLELNLRLIRAGGRILLDPDISVVYYARSSLMIFWKHNFIDAFWVFYGLSFAPMPMSWRHVVPLAFVTSVPALAALSIVSGPFGAVLGAVTVLYAGLCLAFAGAAALRWRRLDYLLAVPAAFAVRHVAYGLGSAWGLVRYLMRRATGSRAPARHSTPTAL